MVKRISNGYVICHGRGQAAKGATQITMCYTFSTKTYCLVPNITKASTGTPANWYGAEMYKSGSWERSYNYFYLHIDDASKYYSFIAIGY